MLGYLTGRLPSQPNVPGLCHQGLGGVILSLKVSDVGIEEIWEARIMVSLYGLEGFRYLV